GQARGGDLQLGAGLRITADARGALAGVEGAESDEGHHLVLAQAALHGRDQRVDRSLGGGLGNLRRPRDLFDQIRLVHASLLSELPQCVVAARVWSSGLGGIGADSSGSGSGSGCRSSAISSTLSIHFTGVISSLFLTLSGMSTRSFTFSSGISTVLMPPRCA